MLIRRTKNGKKTLFLKLTMQAPDLKPLQDRIAETLDAIETAMDEFRRTMGSPESIGHLEGANRLFEYIKDYAEEAQAQLNDFQQDYQEEVTPSEVSPQAPPYLQAMTIAQLRDELRAMGIKGYSGRTKAELIAMLQSVLMRERAYGPGPAHG